MNTSNVNTNYQINTNWFPHWTAAENHWQEAKKSTYWLKHVILAAFMSIPIIGRIAALVERTFFKKEPTPPAQVPSLKEKVTESAPTPKTPVPLPADSSKKEFTKSRPNLNEPITPLNPLGRDIPFVPKPTLEMPKAHALALSREEVALFASGVASGLMLLAGVPAWASWFLGSTPEKASTSFGSMLGSTNLTYPTTPLGLTASLGIATGIAYSQETPSYLNRALTFAAALALVPGAPAPLRTLVQARLSALQIARGLDGIQTCVQSIGKEDSTLIARNLIVHTVNIGTAGYFLFASAMTSWNEVPYYASWILQNSVSEEYARSVMGNSCPGFFNPPPVPVASVLPENATIAQTISYHSKQVANFGAWSVKPIVSCSDVAKMLSLPLPNSNITVQPSTGLRYVYDLRTR